MKIEEAVNGQKVWGWKLAAYLFLAGIGAGAYLVGFIINITHPELVILSKTGILLGPPLVVISSLFLILELGKKNLALLAFYRPISSWISRGTIIITVFTILNLLYIGMWIWPFTLLEGVPGIRLALGSVVAVFAVLTLVYTGVLLGVAKPIAFWDTKVLPILFLISGISTGTMGVAFSLSTYGLSIGLNVEQSLMLLVRCDAFIIIIEALMIGFYLWRMNQLKAARTSVHMVIKGRLAVHFWGGMVVAGLLVPFVFAAYNAYLSTVEPISALILTALASIIGLLGGYMLRYIIVAGGANMPLSIQGIFFPFPKTTPSIEVGVSH